MVDSMNGEAGEGKYEFSLAMDTTKPPTKPVKFDPKNWPNLLSFVNGASAGFVTSGPSFLFLKLAYLMNPESATRTFKSLRPNADLKDVLKRRPNEILLTSIYAATVFGPYEILSRKLENANKGIPLSPYQGFGCAVISGSIGACILTPFSLANACLKAANTTHLSLSQYMYRKAAKEGFVALWKFGGPFANKMFAANVGMLASYKPSFNYFRDSVGLSTSKTVLVAGFVSGLLTAACSYPCLFIQTGVKCMKPGTNGKYPFTGHMDLALKFFKIGGPFVFYSGSIPYFLRVTPGITCLWFFFEEFKKIGESS